MIGVCLLLLLAAACCIDTQHSSAPKCTSLGQSVTGVTRTRAVYCSPGGRVGSVAGGVQRPSLTEPWGDQIK